MADIAGLMESRGFIVPGYDEKSRIYRLRSEEPQGVFVKVFSEKDIPIQVAVGNYDVGIAGRDWIEELTAGYRSIDIVSVSEMGYRHEALFAAGAPGETLMSIREDRKDEFVRIVSEYPNLAERFAREHRFPRYRVFPVWGAAQAYIPRCADIATCVIILVTMGGSQVLELGQEEGQIVQGQGLDLSPPFGTRQTQEHVEILGIADHGRPARGHQIPLDEPLVAHQTLQPGVQVLAVEPEDRLAPGRVQGAIIAEPLPQKGLRGDGHLTVDLRQTMGGGG
jgi:ATP phosphoribosyltransferase